MRNLVIIPGDQLNRSISSLRNFDADADCVWIAELDHEATHVWCHKLRLALFFSAMRHFRDELIEHGFPVEYQELTAEATSDTGRSFAEVLTASIRKLKPERLIVTQPGDWRVLQELRDVAQAEGLELEVCPDDHFFCSLEDFDAWAGSQKALIMENFYRWMRRENDVLMEDAKKPRDGQWNFDKENRKAFGKKGPGEIKSPRSFSVDETTQRVIDLVSQRYADHPGTLEHFDYPVTRIQALAALRDFVEHRLPDFGTFQDAMWTDTDFLNHSRLSAAMNLHLLSAREVVAAAIEAVHAGEAPINSVEGFVRQVIGWREFVRGVYWREMPGYIELNAMRCGDQDVPQSYWDGKTDMNCIGQCMKTVINYSYAHHIQRLMVLGLFAQLLGVHPRKFHDWHMAMYVDAIDWVSLPNTLGMSQHADGAIVGTKPYCASGNYINRMSNYCKDCRFDFKEASGENACPVTALYWDFLHRHRKQFVGNGRMLFQIKNLERKDDETLKPILKKAREIKKVFKNGGCI